MNNIKTIAIVAIVLFVSGYGAGRYFQPPRIETKIEVQEKEVIKKDVVTVIKEITKPDGTKELVTVITDKSTEKKDKQFESVVSKPAEKQWLASVGVNPFAVTDTYSAKIDRRVLGPIFVGGQYIRHKSDNLGLLNITMEF